MKPAGYTYLPSIQSYSREGESGHVQGAVLHKATDVTHTLSKYPGADDKTNLEDAGESLQR